MSTSTLDANGALHSSDTGRFTGHLQREGDPATALAPLAALFCHECGKDVVVEDNGVSHHLTADGAVDFDADADHVAIDDSEFDEVFAAMSA